MRVAVTGGSGFLGRHLLAELEARGIPTSVLSRTPDVPAHMAGKEIVVCDIASPPADLYERLGSPDVLIHLAWGGLPNYRSLHHVNDELPRQYHFLRTLVLGGLRDIVGAGTCFEYGMAYGPLSEDAPSRPDNPYGYAKNALREQLGLVQSECNFSLTWVRLFYMYGEGQGSGSLWAQFNAALKAGATKFPMSGGEQLRDYLPVREIVRTMTDLAQTGGNKGIVNICAGKPISVRSLVEAWIAEGGRRIELQRGVFAYPDYEPFAFWGDRTKLDALLARARSQPTGTV